MRYAVVSLALGMLVGCTKPNPLSCSDGICSDPEYPFCDTRGSLGGNINECVAVSCTPGAFAECRDNVAVTCDSSGTNYEAFPCTRGCDSARNGCIAVPSNDLLTYLDMVQTPADLILASGTINTHTGEINGAMSMPSFLVPAAAANGIPIRVFVARRVQLGHVRVVANSHLPKPAIAILALEAVTVEGTVLLDPLFGTAIGPPGSVWEATCAGGGPSYFDGDGVSNFTVWGAGGGGHATSGARGGVVSNSPYTLPNGPPNWGAAGPPIGTESLEPLQGGCYSGAITSGGGAIQLFSVEEIRISGTVDARGASALRFQSGGGVDGGGGGGGILLEAPSIELTSSAALLAHGGAGASGQADGGTTTSDGPQLGAGCTTSGCGAGGNGANAATAAQPGADITYDSSKMVNTAGGGGGGLGRVRINTADGTYKKASTTKEVAVVTTGTIRR